MLWSAGLKSGCEMSGCQEYVFCNPYEKSKGKKIFKNCSSIIPFHSSVQLIELLNVELGAEWHTRGSQKICQFWSLCGTNTSMGRGRIGFHSSALPQFLSRSATSKSAMRNLHWLATVQVKFPRFPGKCCPWNCLLKRQPCSASEQ